MTFFIMNYTLIIIIIIILLLLLLYKRNNNKNKDVISEIISEIIVVEPEPTKTNVTKQKTKPYVWLYWENKYGYTPAYIELCYKTVLVKCSDSFEIVRLNEKTVYDYLPELITYKKDIDKLIIAQKVDIYRVALLYKYGGLYIDSDTIVLRNPIEIIDKLKDNDYVGFGCTGDICTIGYGKPSNGIMASRQYSILMKNVLNKLLKKIKEKDSFDYFDLGKYVIWDSISDLPNYKYYHYPNKFDGTRDKYGMWIINEIIFSDIPIEYDNENEMIFFTMYNSQLTKEFKTMSELELLSNNWNFVKFLKKGLKN